MNARPLPMDFRSKSAGCFVQRLWFSCLSVGGGYGRSMLRIPAFPMGVVSPGNVSRYFV